MQLIFMYKQYLKKKSNRALNNKFNGSIYLFSVIYILSFLTLFLIITTVLSLYYSGLSRCDVTVGPSV